MVISRLLQILRFVRLASATSVHCQDIHIPTKVNPFQYRHDITPHQIAFNTQISSVRRSKRKGSNWTNRHHRHSHKCGGSIATLPPPSDMAREPAKSSRKGKRRDLWRVALGFDVSEARSILDLALECPDKGIASAGSQI